MLQMARKAGPAVDLHEQIWQLDQRKACVDQRFQGCQRGLLVLRLEQINRRGLSLARFLEVALEIANRVIACVEIAERVAVIVSACSKIGAILPDPTQIGPAGIRA